jgi:hypothetical protein
MDTMEALDRIRRMNNALLVRVILARIARDPRFQP